MVPVLVFLVTITTSFATPDDIEHYENCTQKELSVYNICDSINCFCSNNIKHPFNGIISCKRNDVVLQPLMCVTAQHNDSNKLVAGHCPFTASDKNLVQKTFLNNVTLPDLTESVCGPTRRGVLCGSCGEEYGLAINTFNLECINSTECNSYNWAVYFIVEFSALTVFFLIIVILNVRATAECAHLYILYAQVITLPYNILNIQRDWAAVLSAINRNHNIDSAQYLAWIVDIVYGMWSLNVPFGVVYKLCPDKELGTLAAFAVQYTTAVFPLVLILISYILIKMYQRGYRVVSLLWAPFRKCCVRFRRRLDPQTTIIDAFATFVLLSYTKFTHISLILLAPAPLYDICSNEVDRVLLYDGNIKYLHTPHIPYFILAIAVLIIFVLPPPILLMFYPNKYFQKFLTKCRLNSHTFTVFMAAFQGIYKDGTNGTKDFRFFAGVQFTMRILIFGSYAFISDYFTLYFVLNIVLAIHICLYILCRPYKRDQFNKIDPVLGMLIAVIIIIAIINNIHIQFLQPKLTLQIFFYIFMFIPAVYIGVYMCVWIVKKIHLHCIKDIQVHVNEDGVATTNFGRLVQNAQSLGSRSVALSPVDDRNRLLQNESFFDEDYTSSYSASYVNYCETPTGSSNTTSCVPTNSSNNTGREANTAVDNTIAVHTTNGPSCTTSLPAIKSSTSNGAKKRWPLSETQRNLRNFVSLGEISSPLI